MTTDIPMANAVAREARLASCAERAAMGSAMPPGWSVIHFSQCGAAASPQRHNNLQQTLIQRPDAYHLLAVRQTIPADTTTTLPAFLLRLVDAPEDDEL